MAKLGPDNPISRRQTQSPKTSFNTSSRLSHKPLSLSSRIGGPSHCSSCTERAAKVSTTNVRLRDKPVGG